MAARLAPDVNAVPNIVCLIGREPTFIWARSWSMEATNSPVAANNKNSYRGGGGWDWKTGSWSDLVGIMTHKKHSEMVGTSY